jgi:hypothetical protein
MRSKRAAAEEKPKSIERASPTNFTSYVIIPTY